MNKRIYYTGLTLAITGICAVLPTAASAADESIPSQSSIDSQADQNLPHLEESTLTVSSSQTDLEETEKAANSKQFHPLEETSLSIEAPQQVARLEIESSFPSTEAADAAEQKINLSTVPKLNTTTPIFSESQSSESKISHSFNNSASLLALALEAGAESETIEPLENETKGAVTQQNNIPKTPPAVTPNKQSIPELQSSATKTSNDGDALLALAPDPIESLNPAKLLVNEDKATVTQHNQSLKAPTATPIAQAIPEIEPSIVEPPQTFDNGASLLRPLAPNLTVESTPETSSTAIQRTSVADAVIPAPSTPKPVVQSSLDSAPITPKSSEILDNYGLVKSIKGNKVSVRHLNGKQKTYSLASNAEARQIRRGGLMGFNTNRRGRITRLAPPEIKKVYQGTLIIVEGTKIGMVTPQGERFITTLSKGKIERMGLAPGQPIKITQYQGTWATKVCRPGVVSNRQISPEAMQRQRSFLKGETTSPTS